MYDCDDEKSWGGTEPGPETAPPAGRDRGSAPAIAARVTGEGDGRSAPPDEAEEADALLLARCRMGAAIPPLWGDVAEEAAWLE